MTQRRNRAGMAPPLNRSVTRNREEYRQAREGRRTDSTPLADDGWRLARTRGSHRQYKHPSKPGVVTVAGKPSLDVPPGTLNAILKQAGLKKEK